MPSWFPNIITGEFYQYTDDAQKDYRVAKGLAVNEVAYVFIRQEVALLGGQASQQARLQDYQLLVGNVNNFTNLVQGNVTATTDNDPADDVSSSLVARYPEVVSRYRQRYEQALDKWKAKEKTLLPTN
ncbi:MAG: hypothetical protein EOO61_21935 [Hymenobacter sp.]|nr:MAG: hypothetical protein EOO61_21935 [Hymenobacter sp.]